MTWAQNLLGVPVFDHWWQTETGWTVAGNPLGLGLLPAKPGAAGVPMPGYDLRIVDEQCKEMPANTMGSIVVKLPLPPSCLPTLWQQDERFKESYLTEFPATTRPPTPASRTRRASSMSWVAPTTSSMSRGIGLSTGGMEEVLAAHQDVAECAVVGIADALKGEVPAGFVVLKAGVDRPAAEDRARVLQAHPRKDRPVASFKLALVVARLPKRAPEKFSAAR